MSLFKINKMLFRSLFSKPATTKYPFEPKKHVPQSRGRIDIKIEKCIYCGLCSKKCPTRAIVVTKVEKKWSIDRMRCITCNLCVEVCPTKCLLMDNCYGEPYIGHKEDVYCGA